MSDFRLLYSTFPTRDEALSVARTLLDLGLIACANVYDGVTSLYHWEGEIQQEGEFVLIAKTTAAKVEEAIAQVKRLHSYQTPCIIAFPIAEGFPPFLQWIADETA